jgi:anti-sigma factor RsiW
MTGPRRITEAELHAFVDGELTPEESAEVEALLAALPSELALAREFRDLNSAIKARYAAKLDEPSTPAIETRLARFKPSLLRRIAPVVRPMAASLLLLAAGMAGYLVHARHTAPVEQEPPFVVTALAAHSVYVPEVRHAVEVKADEAHLIRWLTKRIGADVRAPFLGELGWRLMGGRLLPDHGLAAAQFMYEDASGRRLTLYMRKETGLNNTAFRFYERDGYGSFYWIDRPLAYALSGRLSREELTALANAVYAQLETPSGAKDRNGSKQ